jgi:hypothetical protein
MPFRHALLVACSRLGYLLFLLPLIYLTTRLWVGSSVRGAVFQLMRHLLEVKRGETRSKSQGNKHPAHFICSCQVDFMS